LRNAIAAGENETPRARDVDSGKFKGMDF